MSTSLDVFNPSRVGAAPPKVSASFAIDLAANVRHLNIDVDRSTPIHGHVAPYSELRATIGKKPVRR